MCPRFSRPDESGIPTDHQQHLQMMIQILLFALQTESIRVATFDMGHSISCIVFDFTDKKLKRNHHDFSRHRNDPERIAGCDQFTSWLAGECAWLLQRHYEPTDPWLARLSRAFPHRRAKGLGMKGGTFKQIGSPRRHAPRYHENARSKTPGSSSFRKVFPSLRG